MESKSDNSAKFWGELDIDISTTQEDEKDTEKTTSLISPNESSIDKPFDGKEQGNLLPKNPPPRNASLEKALTTFLTHDALSTQERIDFANDLYSLLIDWTIFNKATLLHILYKTMIMLKPIEMDGIQKRTFCIDVLLLSVQEFSQDAETIEKLQYWISNNIDMIADAFYTIAPEQFKMDAFCIIVDGETS